MKKILYLLIIASSFAPLFANASSVHSYSDSYSNSGGISAANNESINTNSSDSYSEIHTTITGENAGGTSTVYIKTDSNGVVHEQTTTKTYPPGQTIVVEASSSAGAPSIVQTIGGQGGAPRHIASTSRMHASTTSRLSFGASSTAPAAFTKPFLPSLFSFIHSMFSWFK